MENVRSKPNFNNPLLTALSNQSSEAIIVLDDRFSINAFNDGSEQLFNFPKTTAINMPLETLCFTSNVEYFLRKHEVDLKKTSTLTISSFIHNKKIYWRIQTIKTDSDIFYLLNTTELEEKNNLNKIHQLETLIDNMPCNVYWVDKNCKMIWCNQNVLTMLNMAHDEFQGKTYEQLSTLCNWPKGLAERLKNDDQTVLSTGMPIMAHEDPPLPHANGTFLNLLTTRVPLRNSDGEIVGIAGISVDITDRKKMEQELIKSKEKTETANYIMTEFIANMGHDLATPISDVGSIAQMLDVYSDECPEFKDLFQTLVTRAAACEEVRKRIINATSISNLEVKPETFSVAKELLELEKKFRSDIEAKKLKLIIHPLTPKKEDVIETDREKFHAILDDLLSNAISFTEEDSITISATKQNDLIIIQVIDTGIGIPADKLDYIFEQYTKLSRSNKHGENFKGVGAGLYLARMRANILGATIDVKSELGKGSTFTLSIPARPKKNGTTV